MKNHLKKIPFLLIFLLLTTNFVFAASTRILGPGDVVKVTVYQNPDLDTQARISDKGTINFPLIGEIEISGMDERDAEAKIRDALQNGQFVKYPQVTLIVEQYDSQEVSVLGEVRNPGKYSLSEGNTIIDIIALAGGITPEGSDKVVLSRFGKDRLRQEIDLNRVFGEAEQGSNTVLEGNDVVFVPRMDVFYIYGEVQRPGMYRLEKGLNVMQAIAIGGSLTERGTLRGITVLRKEKGQESQTLEIQPTDLVMPSDVITVEESLF
jgi:polysaccharide biosynthesis/export protein